MEEKDLNELMNKDYSKIRDKLYKDLYLAARAIIHPMYQDDPEAVKALRDGETYRIYNKHYDELTNQQLMELIEDFKHTPKQYPSKYQLSLFKYYAISCALVYCDLKAEFVIGHDVYSGDALRKLLNKDFADNKMLPKSIVAHLYSNWINPKSNQFLVEGRFRKKTRKPEQCYFEKLTSQEVQYLIRRFEQIHNNCRNKVQPEVKQWLN